ncbi:MULTISPECIES: hypothetical protein [Streptomyces]|uniref:hypothetical protein n=1 Tax=Streptomyces TaxID=1883 RepID=UPI001C2F0B60|nr:MULTISPECIES: hypothetical protein [Streptomyces]MBV1945851.1 hypothetical protein [Streptomyces sp. BV129]BDH03169.1 hypothetical protein HEK131_03960 [Streptomyces seoulensis]
MKKLLFATLAVAASSAALAAPAHAAADDGRWTAEGTTRCAADLTVAPVVKAVSPLPMAEQAPACGEGSLLHHR